MKKLSALLLLSATMILASCGKPAESKPVDSEPASETTSQADSKPESAPTSASTPAPSTPASSASAPASSSRPASSSSRPASSSSRPASSSSQAPASSQQAELSMTLTGASLVTENNVSYLKLTGTSTNMTAANGKFALGLKHKDSASSGLADPLDGEWLVGGETPAAADYKFAPAIAADGSFEVKLSFAGITLVKGAYEIYVGPQGQYAKLDLQQTEYGGGTFKTNGLGVILRSDLDLLFAEELPPVTMTEATTSVEGEGADAKVILKVGGELGSATAAEFEALPIKVLCERQVGGWKQNNMAAEKVSKVVEGTKGYVKIDVTELEVGGYQVKIGFDGTSTPDTKMECDSYDKRNEPTVLGSKEYAPYFQAGGNTPEALYGCCGLYIDNAAVAITEATTRFEAEAMPSSNVTVANKEEGDEATSGTGYAKEITKTSGWWSQTGQLDAVVKLAAAGTYKVKVAYKSANATEAGAFELAVDGASKGNKGAAAAEWTVFESDAFDLAAGKHTISVKGISNVKTDIDYVELVKHDHMASMTWAAEVAGTTELCAHNPGTCDCGKTAIKMAAGADLNHNLTTGGKLGKGASGSYDGTKISSYKFTAAAAGTVSIYAEGAFDARGNDAASFYHGKVNGGLGKLTDGSTNTVMKMNGAAITLPTETYGELLGTTTENAFKAFKIAEVEVQEGANEFTITATNSYGLKWNYFAIVF